MEGRRLFVAGATGAVGRTLMRVGPSLQANLVPHVRPKTAGNQPPYPDAAVFELSDDERLTGALRGCTTVVQLIGTMRKRFPSGDTYETSDIGTTRLLVEGSKRAGTIDHLVLLSSVGAGRPMGAYLKAKAEAERLVRESGIPWTIFRPSAFVGEGHQPPGASIMTTLTRAIGADRYVPIAVEELARAIVHVAVERAPLEAVLEGEPLWAQVRAATRR